MKWFAVLVVIAVGLALGLPPDPHTLHQLHTSAVAYRFAILALLIPYIVIWYAGFYAFAKLQEYSKPIKDAKDGKAFRKVTFGMGILAFGLIIPTIISLILNSIAAYHSGFVPAATIISNYISLLVPVLAFLFMSSGARLLIRSVRGWSKESGLRWFAPWFLLLAVLFTQSTVNNYFVRHSYHLSLYVLMITIIVPYLYAWFLGLLSAYELSLYSKYVKGLIYKRALKQFASGIAIAIGGSIAIQFVNVTIAERLKDSLGKLLIADYILLIIVAIGLILMALGTNKLKRIEEV